MFKIDFEEKKHIHFIGIGGISMSALAEILISKGFVVTGSDATSSKLIEKLEKLGAEISIGHDENNIPENTNIIVYTAAINEDNPELIKAKELGLPVLSRASLLGQIMKNFPKAIGVSGTHGKTTTTSMLSQILVENEKDPTILLGGILSTINGNTRIGSSDYFLTEACEYTNSFLSFAPTIGVILNVSQDHMDYFNDIDEIRKSFKDYANLIPQDGYLILNDEISSPEYFYPESGAKVLTFGLKDDSDFRADNIVNSDIYGVSFDLIFKGDLIQSVKLQVPGLHNISNALAAAAVAYSLNIEFKDIIKSLESYSGCNRRFEIKGKLGEITIIDDYAHHPEEITATLNILKDYKDGETWCVFQPHTYTRTSVFLKDFAKALSLADHVILTDIYAAREKNLLGISSQSLLTELEKLNVDSYYFSSFDEIESFLLVNCKEKDLLITMGAGDVVSIGEKLLGYK